MTQTALNAIKISRFWLLAAAALLSAIYFAVIVNAGDTAHLGISGLFYLAVASLLWDRRKKIKPQTSLLGIILGAVMIAMVLALSLYVIQLDLGKGDIVNAEVSSLASLRLLPLISGLALAFLTLGIKGLRSFWRELTILFFLGAPSIVASFVIDLSPITARFSAFLLWYSGFDVVLKGLVIALPGGGVEVYYGCSGIESMAYLLGLSAVCLVMFPLFGIKRFFMPMIAIAVGFFINAVRVSLMAILSASGDKAAFDYWHQGDGSLIFGLAAVLIFGSIYMLVLQRNPEQAAEQLSSSASATVESNDARY